MKHANNSFTITMVAVLFAPFFPGTSNAETLIFDNGVTPVTANGGQPSDLDAGFFFADDFILPSSTTISHINFSGVYAPSNTPLATDAFTFRFFDNNVNRPGNLITTLIPGNNVNRIDSGADLMGRDIFSYNAPANLVLGPGVFWVSIVNDTTGDIDDNWNWIGILGTGNNHGDTGPLFATAPFNNGAQSILQIFGSQNEAGLAPPGEGDNPDVIFIDFAATQDVRLNGLNTANVHRTVVGAATSGPIKDLNRRRQRMRNTADCGFPVVPLLEGGSGGFTPQTWDISGNETNFFIRDVTDGSVTPFQIQPGASGDADPGIQGIDRDEKDFEDHLERMNQVIRALGTSKRETTRGAASVREPSYQGSDQDEQDFEDHLERMNQAIRALETRGNSGVGKPKPSNLGVSPVFLDDRNARLEVISNKTKSKGDLNGDGVVDVLDLNILGIHWQTNNAEGDVTGDGRVDAADLNVIGENWQQPVSSTTDTFRYLNYAANQHTDYRVALGLAEGEEVELTGDTLYQGDRGWAGMPMAMMGGPVAPVSVKAVVAVPEGGAKNPVEIEQVAEYGGLRNIEVFTEFDFGFYDIDNLTSSLRGFETDSYAGSVGLEYRLTPRLFVGGAFSHLWSDTEMAGNLGNIDLDGTLLSAYATAFWRGCYFDFLYSYGNFDDSIRRGTIVGGTARGETDSRTHNLSFATGKNFLLSRQIVTGPTLGLDYGTGNIDGYTETGAGRFNLIYPDDNFESMVSRLGWQATHHQDTGIGRVSTQVTAAWAHEFMPESDSVSATLQTSPFVLVSGGNATRFGGFGAEGEGAHAGTDWLELGAGVTFDLPNDWELRFGYEGQFGRNNASAHFGSVKLGCEWGDHLFTPKVEPLK